MNLIAAGHVLRLQEKINVAANLPHNSAARTSTIFSVMPCSFRVCYKAQQSGECTLSLINNSISQPINQSNKVIRSIAVITPRTTHRGAPHVPSYDTHILQVQYCRVTFSRRATYRTHPPINMQQQAVREKTPCIPHHGGTQFHMCARVRTKKKRGRVVIVTPSCLLFPRAAP